jgi:uncharacterized protein YprB with RNaseH-like and TPR domain
MIQTDINKIVKLRDANKSWEEIATHFPDKTANAIRKQFFREIKKTVRKDNPKILLFDIETAPLLVYTWGLYDQNIALNQIVKDWHLLSWSAKWLGSDETLYMDQRNKKDVSNDKVILKAIWKLLNEADVLITQNGISFDMKKLNARFILNGLKPVSSSKHIDTLRLAKKHFAFTSNKLEYMSHKLCTKFKKLKHSEFGGFELWKECLAGNIRAWKEMERYNRQDVLSLEELYFKLQPFDNTINFGVIGKENALVCNCGNAKFKKQGSVVRGKKHYTRLICSKCGAEHKGDLCTI